MRKLRSYALALGCLLLLGLLQGASARARFSAIRPIDPREPGRSVALFSLDGVRLELETAFLSAPRFIPSDPKSAIQTATAIERKPFFRALSVTAVPFGTSPPTESLPIAGPGRAEAYRDALRTYRIAQGGHPQEGTSMRLFGRDVRSVVSTVELPVRDGDAAQMAVSEWVVEAGGRLWIVRARWALRSRETSSKARSELESLFVASALRSDDLAAPSTSLTGRGIEALEANVFRAASAQVTDLPNPSWWDGECDTVNYTYATGVPAYPLGTAYRGVTACGPRPWADEGPERWVNFGAGASQIEWQCPEISKRFLFLAYGIPPYPAHGKQMVSAYDGDLLEKVWNPTPGRVPQPDDVLAYGAATTYGHTAVVIGTAVNAAGNGTVQVMEQNASPTGLSTLLVENWEVLGYTDVIGWLHHPGWFVQYFEDRRLTDRCATAERSSTYLFEHWAEGASVAGCSSDRFGARFSRNVDFAGGDYSFALGYDEVARLKLDGVTILDGWDDAQEHYAVQRVEQGSHRLTVEYYDSAGSGALTAYWWGPGHELTREARDESRWYAEHWGNPSLWWDPVVTARGGSGSLDHDWGWGSPDLALPVDYFSSRYRRTVALGSGRWRFELFADDGVRFFVDDQPIIDQWQPQRALLTSTVALDGGHHQLRVEHYENEEVAEVSLTWEQVSDDPALAYWITSPITGAVVGTCPLTVDVATGSLADPVDGIDLRAWYDHAWHEIGVDRTSPYRWVWDCDSVPDQEIWLAPRAWVDAETRLVDLRGAVRVRLERLTEVYIPFLLHRYGEAAGVE